MSRSPNISWISYQPNSQRILLKGQARNSLAALRAGWLKARDTHAAAKAILNPMGFK
jgi:hypothetical protein